MWSAWPCGRPAITSHPAAPAILRQEFSPGPCGGSSSCLVSLTRSWTAERSGRCPPVLARSYLGPAGCAGRSWRSRGSPTRGVAGRRLPGSPSRGSGAGSPRLGSGGTGRHRPCRATARGVRGCPILIVPAPPDYVPGRGGAYSKPRRGHARRETTRFLSTTTRRPFRIRTIWSSQATGWRVGLSAPRPGGFPVPTGPYRSLLTTAAQGPFFHGYASVPVPGRCCAASRGLPSAHLSRETPSLREGRGSGEGWAVLTLAEKAG